MTREKTQAEKFEEAAKSAGADEDEGRWEERLRKIAKQKRPPSKPTKG